MTCPATSEQHVLWSFYISAQDGLGGQARLCRLVCGKALPFRKAEYHISQARLRLSPAAMATINKDTPCLFITTVTRNRLPVFRTDALKAVACAAVDEARRSGGFALFAYVIMPEHLHALADGTLQASETLRYINGILSRRVIGYLKEGGFTTSLEKLRGAPKGRRHQYSMVDHHSNALPVFSERFFMQKVNYIHRNPVRAGLVVRAEDYRWSSARCWSGRAALEDEPLRVDLEKMVWRRPR